MEPFKAEKAVIALSAPAQCHRPGLRLQVRNHDAAVTPAPTVTVTVPPPVRLRLGLGRSRPESDRSSHQWVRPCGARPQRRPGAWPAGIGDSDSESIVMMTGMIRVFKA